MSESVGSIYYTVDAHTRGLLEAERDINRSTQRMGRGFDHVDERSSRASKSMSRLTPIAGAVKAAAVGGAVALSGFSAALLVVARSAATAARELENQARLAGVSVEAFQQLAYASKSVGVEQGKLADIFKDTQDKIGDFLATGGGELKDYFENIAPLVGQSADEFRELSGPQALIKLQKGLDAANLSMEQQVFYLESVADEASLLQPLLRNNAEGLRQMAKEARDLNAVLSQSEVDRLSELAQGFDQLAQQIRTETSRAILQFDDLIKGALESASEGLTALARGFNVFMDSFREDAAKRSIAGINAELDEVFDNKRRLEKRIDMFGEESAQGQQAAGALREVKAEYDALIARKKELQTTGSGVTVPDELNLERIKPSGSRLPGLGGGGGSGDPDAAKKARKRFEALKKQLETERETIEREYRERNALIRRFTEEGSREQVRLLERSSKERREALQGISEEYQGLIDELYPVRAAQRTFREEMERLELAQQIGMIDDLSDAQRLLRESMRSDESWQDAYGFSPDDTKQLDKANDAARELGMTFSSAFEDAVVEGESFREVLQGIAKDVQRIMIRKSITEPAADALGGVDWGGLFNFGGGAASYGGSGWAGSVVTAASGGYVSGPGTSTSDSIPARLSDGEFVVNAQATSRPGVRPMLEALNSNRAYAKGGFVGSGATSSSPASGGFEVHIHNEGGEPMQVGRSEQRRGGGGQRELHLWVNRIVDQRMKQNFQDGYLDRTMRDFGARRQSR